MMSSGASSSPCRRQVLLAVFTTLLHLPSAFTSSHCDGLGTTLKVFLDDAEDLEVSFQKVGVVETGKELTQDQVRTLQCVSFSSNIAHFLQGISNSQ